MPPDTVPPDTTAETSLFTRWAQGYVAERFGQQIAVLLAGAVTAAGDLGLASLRDGGADIIITEVDDDQPVNRAALATHPELSRCTLGDLRTISLPQRSYDIVACTLLLDRIHHAELVLDRLTGAVKPGGLLLLQIRDRDAAAGFLDRVLPGWLRAADLAPAPAGTARTAPGGVRAARLGPRRPVLRAAPRPGHRRAPATRRAAPAGWARPRAATGPRSRRWPGCPGTG